MPASSSRDTLVRQWELLRILKPYPRGQTASQLLKELNDRGYTIGKRQVLRDLDLLSTVFPLTESETSDKRGTKLWHWMEDAPSQVPGIDVPDAISTVILESRLSAMLPQSYLDPLQPRFSQAKKKIESLKETNPAASWPDRVRSIPATFNLLLPEIKPDILAVCQESLLKNRKLDVTYYSLSKDQDQQLLLNVHGLIHQGHAPYLIATANSYNDLRMYSITRVLHASLSEEQANLQKGFDIDRFIESGGLSMPVESYGKIKIKLSASHWLAQLLRETPIAEDQIINDREDESIVTASVLHTRQLEWWLLSLGESALVLGPAKLRNRMAKIIGYMADMYA